MCLPNFYILKAILCLYFWQAYLRLITLHLHSWKTVLFRANLMKTQSVILVKSIISTKCDKVKGNAHQKWCDSACSFLIMVLSDPYYSTGLSYWLIPPRHSEHFVTICNLWVWQKRELQSYTFEFLSVWPLASSLKLQEFTKQGVLTKTWHTQSDCCFVDFHNSLSSKLFFLLISPATDLCFLVFAFEVGMLTGSLKL